MLVAEDPADEHAITVSVQLELKQRSETGFTVKLSQTI